VNWKYNNNNLKKKDVNNKLFYFKKQTFDGQSEGE
jgi:hypothetical protein